MLAFAIIFYLSIHATLITAKPTASLVDLANKIKVYSDTGEESPAPHAALTQFSQLISRKNRQFDKKSKHHTHLAYAQVYFNDLYTHGSRDTQKALTLLAFELESVLAKKSWSTEKKYLAFNAFLTNMFGEIEQTLVTKPEKEKMQRLYKHLQAGISPTVIGRQEAIKNLPWTKMIAGAGLMGAGYYGYTTGVLQKAKKHFKQSFETLGHVGDNIREARRETEAFFANIQPEGTGHVVEDKWVDRRTGTVINENSDGSIPPHAIRELRYLRKMPDNRDLENWKQDPNNWVKKPEGIMDRLVKVAEAATPLLPEVATRLQDATAEQDRWFRTHKISTDRTERLWVPIKKADGSEEMRYAETIGHSLDDLGITQDAAQAGGYWQDPESLWHKTHLPKRNIGEEALAVTEKVIATLNSDYMRELISRLTRDLNNSEEGLMSFLRKNDLLQEGATKPWQLADNVSIDWNSTRTKMVYKKQDGEEVAIPESDFSRLVTAADKLINQLGDKTSTAGSFLSTLTTMLNDSRTDMNSWLQASGLASDDQGTLLPDVTLHTDSITGNAYYTKDDIMSTPLVGGGSSATTTPLKRFYPPISPVGNLFNTLGALAKKEDLDITVILNKVFEEIDAIQDAIAFSVGRLTVASKTTGDVDASLVAAQYNRHRNYLLKRNGNTGNASPTRK